MKSNTSATYAFMLVIGDFLAILGAFSLAYILRVSISDAPARPIYAADYARIFAFITPFWLILFGFLGLYHRDTYEWRWRETTRLFVGAIIGVMGVITFEFAGDEPILPARIVAVYGFMIAFALLLIERSALRQLRKLLRTYGWGMVNTMVIGDGRTAQEMVEALKNSVASGYKVVALISKERPIGFKGKHYTDLEKGLGAIEKLEVHSIILAELLPDPEKNALIQSTAQAHHCGFRFVPSQEGMVSNTMEVELFQGMPVIAVHQTALTGWGRIVKRLFDITVSSLGLIILSPFMLIIGLFIRLTNWGPVFFKQPRLSRYDRTITIYKFRTLKMSVNGLLPEEGFEKLGKPELARQYRENGDRIAKDPRITYIGRGLRKFSLDEIPQLFNILRGDISLVGPRALVHRELEDYPYKNLILSVKSGLTGLAQISGRRDIPFEERRKLDLYYVQNWSFWLDLKILARTAIEVIKGSGDAS